MIYGVHSENKAWSLDSHRWKADVLKEYGNGFGPGIVRFHQRKWKLFCIIAWYAWQFHNHFTSLHLSLSLVDRRGTKDDQEATFLHPSLVSAFRRASPNFRPVHFAMLSSHLFFCLPFLLPPCTVPWRIVFASPVDPVVCPYHLNLCFFTVVRRSL